MNECVDHLYVYCQQLNHSSLTEGHAYMTIILRCVCVTDHGVLRSH